MENRILSLLCHRKEPHNHVHTTVVEPVAEMVDRFKERVAAQASQDMTYDWRTQTMEEYQNTAGNQGSKFHFICSVHSIYYMADLKTCLKDLYDRLESKGMMLIILSSGKVKIVRDNNMFQQFSETHNLVLTNADVLTN